MRALDPEDEDTKTEEKQSSGIQAITSITTGVIMLQILVKCFRISINLSLYSYYLPSRLNKISRLLFQKSAKNIRKKLRI